MSQVASPQPLSSRSVSSGRGGGREVEVGVRPAEHRVAHRPADQGQLVAGPGEQRTQRVEHLRHPVQLVADGALELDHGEWTGLGGGHDRPS